MAEIPAGLGLGSSRPVADILRKEMETKEFLDVGRGASDSLDGVSQVRFHAAVSTLESEGYLVHRVKIPKEDSDQLFIAKILARPGTTWAESKAAFQEGRVSTITEEK